MRASCPNIGPTVRRYLLLCPTPLFTDFLQSFHQSLMNRQSRGLYYFKSNDP